MDPSVLKLSEQELKALIEKGESENVEFCESPKDKDKIAKAICAFSNNIADLGFVERFGFGLPQARKALKENGNPELELKAELSFICAFVKKAS